MDCTACGAVNRPNSKFCSTCGKPLNIPKSTVGDPNSRITRQIPALDILHHPVAPVETQKPPQRHQEGKPQQRHKQTTLNIRFPALRTVGTIIKILSILTALITLAASFGVYNIRPVYVNGGDFIGGIAAVLIFLYGTGFAIILYAIGESLFVLLAMEENTRRTAVLLRAARDHAPSEPQLEAGGRASAQLR